MRNGQLSPRPVLALANATKASSRETLASGTLQIVIPTSGTDNSEDETVVPATPPLHSSSRGLDPEAMTDAVTTSVIHRQRVENEAAASSSHSQEGQLSGRQTPAAGNDLVGAGPQRGQNSIIPVETHTWEEVESAVWQSARGTSNGAMGYALAILDQMRTNVEDRYRAQTRALPTGCQEGEEFGRNPQMQNLLGRT